MTKTPTQNHPWRGNGFERFLEYCRAEKNYSDQTLRAYSNDLDNLGEFCWEREMEISLHKVDEGILERYLAHLRTMQLSDSTVERHVSSISAFFQFLVNKEIRQNNPSSNMSFKNRSRKLPTVWSESEIEQFLDTLDKPRDNALFELLYSTGMRVSELTSLNWSDYSPSDRTVTVLGKGGKERIAPVGPESANKLKKYRSESNDEPDLPIFKNRFGERLTTRGVRYLVDKYKAECDVTKSLSPHVFRHSCATHMLNRGASLKTVQALLGHESLSTTQVYTHVSTSQLKKVYDQSHPRAYQNQEN